MLLSNVSFKILDKTNALISSFDLLNTIYPVGSIYMSTNSTSPANFIGGTWERIQGQFLLGASSSYSAGSTGGSADAIVVSHSHTFSGTTSSNGSHTHGLSIDEGIVARPGAMMLSINYNGYYDGDTDGPWNANITHAGNHTHTYSGTTSTNGSSGTGKNMPPYLAVYIWKRTA